jgi:hypothetical protein
MKTVFIIGAGASSEVRLPVGTELKKHIADALIDWPKKNTALSAAFYDLSHRQGYDINELFRASSRICTAMPQAISIDNFLNTHSNNRPLELCAKLSIAHTILAAESRSSLFIDRRNETTLKFSQIEKIWLNAFMQLLTQGCRLQDLESRLSSVCLIIFNYDRCVEHYIYHSLQNYFGISASEAATLLKGMEIYHPYGAVGSLPCFDTGDTTEFGVTPQPLKLIELAIRLKTFTEGTDEESSDILAIRRNVKTALRLVFLGFAFHPINMELLFLNPAFHEVTTDIPQAVFATTHGLSGSDTDKISSELATYGKYDENNIHLQRLTCSGLFQEYWRSLSFM